MKLLGLHNVDSLEHTLVTSEVGESWSHLASRVILSCAEELCPSVSGCSMMLTGGKTAETLYKYWDSENSFASRKVTFYFGDERCVPPDHEDSNYNMASSAFLRRLEKDPHCTSHRMEADRADHEVASREYGEKLPESIDILLFGLGEDGHVASLFPYAKELDEYTDSVVAVSCAKPPADRLTITPKVISKAKNIFILALGYEKGAVLGRAMSEPENISQFPLLLARKAILVMDDSAAAAYKTDRQ